DETLLEEVFCQLCDSRAADADLDRIYARILVAKQTRIAAELSALETYRASCAVRRRGRPWPWPTTEIGPAQADPGGPDGRRAGILGLSGYAGGRHNGLPEEQRRERLDAIYECHFPDVFATILGAAEVARWGEPETSERLRVLANTM